MTDLRITDVKTYIVPGQPATTHQWRNSKTFLFVKLETNKGIDGWGEAYVLNDRERSEAVHIDEMKRHLLDFDPSMIKGFQYWAYNYFAERRCGIDLYCAISAVEIAMWDIMGKYYNTPVYNLLGGPFHKKLRVYANLGARAFRTPDEVAQAAKEMVKQSFTAVKLYPFTYLEEEDVVVERIAKVREAIGDKVDLMIDVWRAPDPKKIINVAKRIEPLNIIWYEEPISSDDLDTMAGIRKKVSLPIVTGECICGKRGFNEVIKKNAADILNADVSVVGGILELKEIATLAETNYIQVGPHNCNSTTVATSATVHAACTMPNFFILEIFPWFWDIGDKICKNQLRIQDGFYHIPEGPGLGLDMNEDFLASQVYKEKPPQKITGFELKGA